MKTFTICLCLFLCVVCCSGCGEIEYEFLHSTDDIVTIEIVQKSAYQKGEKEPQYTEICKIEEKDVFLADFKMLTCYRTADPPKVVPDDAIVIRIVYSNGDYELIHYCAQIRVHDGEINPYGIATLLQEEFDQLLEKYLPEATEEQA
jgi:hypothetical protein